MVCKDQGDARGGGDTSPVLSVDKVCKVSGLHVMMSFGPKPYKCTIADRGASMTEQ